MQDETERRGERHREVGLWKGVGVLCSKVFGQTVLRSALGARQVALR